MKPSKLDLTYLIVMVVLLIACAGLYGYIFGRWCTVAPVNVDELLQQCEQIKKDDKVRI